MRQRITAVWVAAMAAAAALAAMPAARADVISQAQEMQMGSDAARQIEAQWPVARDPGGVVAGIGRRLAAVSSRPNLPWQFRVLQNAEVNALSVPAHVFVNTGLLQFVGGDRQELAAVIAHEVAHTTRKHAVRQTEKAMIGNLAMQLLFRNQQGAARNLAGIAANLAMLGYSRQDELEADRVGVDYMIRAGYDPRAMIRFFQRLQAREGRDSGGLSRYFQTHPPTGERIAAISRYLAARGR